MEEPLPEGDFAEVLQNGVVLCKLMNKLALGSVKKFKEKVTEYTLNLHYSLFICLEFEFASLHSCNDWLCLSFLVFCKHTLNMIHTNDCTSRQINPITFIPELIRST